MTSSTMSRSVSNTPLKPFRSAYVAGPMSGYPEFNFPLFDEVTDYLRKRLALRVISPAEIDRADGFDEKGLTGLEVLTDEQRHQFARNDIKALLDVDAIVLLPGWQNSTGATNEAKIASWLGLHAFEARLSTPYLFEVDWDGAASLPWSLHRIDLEHKWSSVPLPPAVDLDVVLAEDEELKRLLAEEDAIEAAGVPTPPNARTQVLSTAESLVNGDRNNQYGDPLQDFQRVARFWNNYLDLDNHIDAADVAAMMALLKLSRISWSPTKLDSWVDLAGYAACGWHCVDATTEEVIK